MTGSEKSLRICKKGHEYYKSSSCPVCPICENEQTPKQDFLASLASPARRALINAGINTLTQLSKYTETEILNFHGMGPGSIPKLRKALESKGLSFVMSR